MLYRLFVMLGFIAMYFVLCCEFIIKIILNFFIVLIAICSIVIAPVYWIITSKSIVQFYDHFPSFLDLYKNKVTEMMIKKFIYKPFYSFCKDEEWFQNMFIELWEDDNILTDEEIARNKKEKVQNKMQELGFALNNNKLSVEFLLEEIEDVDESLKDSCFDEDEAYFKEAIKKFKELP